MWPQWRLIRSAIVIGTLGAADMATWYFKANDTTMRGMPFDERIPIVVRNKMNLFYSVSQVLATMNCLFSNNIDTPFLVLFPIQIAAFLMTLVKKGYLSTTGWHVLYSLALGLNYAHAFYLGKLVGSYNYWRLALLFCLLRFEFRFNKYLLWIPISLLKVH
jgi:hypothetical protein